MSMTDEMLYRHAAEARSIWLAALPEDGAVPEHRFSERFRRRMGWVVLVHGVLYAFFFTVLLPLTLAYCFLAVRLKALVLSLAAPDEMVVVSGIPFILAAAVGGVLCAALLLWKHWVRLPPVLAAVCFLLWLVPEDPLPASVLLGLGCAGMIGSAPALKQLLQAALFRISAVPAGDTGA